MIYITENEVKGLMQASLHSSKEIAIKEHFSFE